MTDGTMQHHAVLCIIYCILRSAHTPSVQGGYTFNMSAKSIPAGGGGGGPTAAAPWDRVALVQHGMDMWGHREIPYTDRYPPYIANASAWCNSKANAQHRNSCTPGEKFGCPCTPAWIPFRALTNAKVENLVVAGLSMAQSYLTNSAIRMHPTEWASGTAAGAAAAYMALNKVGSTHAMLLEKTTTTTTAAAPTDDDDGGGDGSSSIAGLQAMLRARHQPLEWTIDGKVYPP